jgi:sRNA-binding protein
MKQTEYVIELERTTGKLDHTNATLPSLTKGQRLKVAIGAHTVDAEVIEVTQLKSHKPPRYKLRAREVKSQ